MQYAVWIALAVVVIAILPALLKRDGGSGSDSGGDGDSWFGDGDGDGGD